MEEYMKLPNGFGLRSSEVGKLERALYRVKQAG